MAYEIIGIGKSEPKTIVTNEKMEEMVDTSSAWIRERTGILERRIAKGETMREHALHAAQIAIYDANIQASEISYIIFATIGGDYFTPSQASVLALDLGISCPAIDVNAACSGFLYALDLAEGKFLQGLDGYILVVGMEFMSKYMDFSDRRTCVLFGDGGGAVVMKKGNGLLASHYSSQPNIDVLNIPNNEKHVVSMNGKEVYKYAVTVMVEEVKAVCKKANSMLEDIDLIIPHQANARIIEGAAKRLNIRDNQIITRIAYRGNTSAGSIPMVLDDLYQEGALKKGMKLILVAFGGGLSAGAICLEWKKEK